MLPPLASWWEAELARAVGCVPEVECVPPPLALGVPEPNVLVVVVRLGPDVVVVTPCLGRVVGVVVAAWPDDPALGPPVVIEVGVTDDGADVVVVTAGGGG